MGNKPDYPEHLLVTGMPRTGSTVVADALARHRDIAMLSESRQENAALIIGKRYAGNKLYMPAQVDYKFSSDTIGLLSLRRRPSNRKRGYLYSYMEQRSKIIVTYREASSSIEAVVRSMGVQAEEAVRIWSRAMDLTARLVKRYRDRLFLCEYEALKNDPAGEIGDILQFLDLPADPETDRFVEQFGDWAKGTSSDSSVEKLRLSELSPKAFAMYNGICSFRLEQGTLVRSVPPGEAGPPDSRGASEDTNADLEPEDDD